MINGWHMAAGGMGALVGTIPVEHALQVTDWRGVMYLISALALVASIVLFTVVPNRGGSETSTETLRNQISDLSKIYKSPAFWRIVPLCVTTQCSFLAIQSLWSGPWLADVAGLSRDTVADYLFWVACAMVSGFIGLGIIAARLNKFGVSTLNFGILMMALFIVVQVGLVFQWTEFTLPIWLLFGFFGTAGILPFAVLPHLFPPALAGRVITSVNLMIFLAAFGAQWGIGAISNLWPKTQTGGYAVEGFEASFGVILGFQVLGLIWCGIYKGERAEAQA